MKNLNMARKFMSKSSLFFLLFLSGCAGTLLLEGEGKYIDAEFPDIRTVPSREEANKLQNTAGTEDLKSLEQDREKMKARDEALREEAFQAS